MLHVAVLVTTSSELGGPGVCLPMDALAEAKASIAVASSSSTSDSEGEVAHRSYHFCGQQMQEFHCSAPEHVSLDWLVDPVTDVATGDAANCFSKGSAGTAAATAATVGENGQPLAPEAQCAVTTAAIGQNGQPLAAEAQHAVTTAAIESPALDSRMASPWQFLFSECGLKFNLEIFNRALN